jgi:microcystin-dependent protein
MTADLIGEVRPFARGELPEGWMPCDGSELVIAEQQPLFALLGWRFGGDRRTTFRVPALWSNASRPAPKVIYGIAVNGLYPTKDDTMLEATVGEIRFFAGHHAPTGWVPCDGRVLPIEAPYLDLYSVIGKRWGGDVETFGVPNLWDEVDADVAGSVGRMSYLVAVAAPPSPPADDPDRQSL